jgi:CheY-like chemotaxis protein
VVLLDLVMPGIGGAMTARIIQAEYPSVPLIIMSGYTSEPNEAIAGLPAAAFLHKPFGVEALRTALAVTTHGSARSRAHGEPHLPDHT